MAFWIEGRESISDINRTRGGGEIIRYGANTDDDIASLPGPNGQNQGSSCLTLTGNFYKLGTDPAAGINGWVRL